MTWLPPSAPASCCFATNPNSIASCEDTATKEGEIHPVTESAGGSSPGETERDVYRWYVLGILVLIYIFGSADRSVVSVIAELLKREFDLTDAQIGALGGMAYSATYAVAVLPIGWQIDRTDRRRLLGITVAIWSALTMCGAVATSFPMLVLARMGVGAAEAAASPASLSLIADTFPVRLRNTAVGIYYAGTSAGQLVIFVGGGWLLLHYSWRAVFLVAGVPGFILAALLFFTVREPIRGVFDTDARLPREGRGPTITQSITAIFRRSALRYAIAASTVSNGVNFSLTVWTASFLVRIHGLTVSAAATWTGIGMGLSMVIGSLLIGPFSDRFSRGIPARLASIPAAASFLGVFAGALMTLAPTLEVSLVGLAIFSVLAGFSVPTGYALILSLAAPEARGSTLAVTKLISIFVGTGFMPMITGTISDAIGGPYAMRWAILATIALQWLAAFCFFMAGRRTRERPAAVASVVALPI
jgi:MFS family permease